MKLDPPIKAFRDIPPHPPTPDNISSLTTNHTGAFPLTYTAVPGTSGILRAREKRFYAIVVLRIFRIISFLNILHY